MEPALSYHGDQSVKSKYLARVEAHRIADHLVQGYGYWDDGKGCAVGCTLERNSDCHAQYPIELGLPKWLAHLEDHLFENLPVEAAREWPEQFLSSIPVGVTEKSFDAVRDRFQIFWLERQKTQIDQAKYGQVVEAIDGVIKLLRAALAGDEPLPTAWSAARSVARSTARSVAWSTAWSAAWSAAWAAAESAARSAAESAARSATWSAAWSSVWSTAWSAARSARYAEALVKRDWLLVEFRNLQPVSPYEHRGHVHS